MAVDTEEHHESGCELTYNPPQWMQPIYPQQWMAHIYSTAVDFAYIHGSGCSPYIHRSDAA